MSSNNEGVSDAFLSILPIRSSGRGLRLECGGGRRARNDGGGPGGGGPGARGGRGPRRDPRQVGAARPARRRTARRLEGPCAGQAGSRRVGREAAPEGR